MGSLKLDYKLVTLSVERDIRQGMDIRKLAFGTAHNMNFARVITGRAINFLPTVEPRIHSVINFHTNTLRERTTQIVVPH